MAYWKRCRHLSGSPGKEKNAMALTAARKKANAKYEAKAYDKTLIRLPKGRLDEIRAHIEPAGESLNGFIGRAIVETMERDSAGWPQEAIGTPSRAWAVSFPPEVLKAAQGAADAAGQPLPDFIRRAVRVLEEFDQRQRRMGINPVTGKRIERAVADPPTEQQSPTGAAKAAEGIDPEKVVNELRLMFRGMELRCYNPDVPEYAKYGAKGVTICDEWRGDGGFSNFVEWCIGNGYSSGLLIDRKDAAGPYSPDNCILKAR